MYRKLALLSTLVFLMGTVSFGTIDPNNGTTKSALKNGDPQEIIVADQDSTEQQEVVVEPKKKETVDEEESVSILSINVLFEIITHFNLKDLFSLPSK